MKEIFQEGWNNFREGGGLRTVGRRFVQTVPFWVVFPGSIGFGAGEILPGMPDLLNTTNPTTTLYSNEYGPQWAEIGAGIGLGVAVIDAVAKPFFVGAAIRRGEMDEIPEMPNVVDYAVRQTRRMIDHVRGRREEDVQDALSSFYTNLPPRREE